MSSYLSRPGITKGVRRHGGGLNKRRSQDSALFSLSDGNFGEHQSISLVGRRNLEAEEF